MVEKSSIDQGRETMESFDSMTQRVRVLSRVPIDVFADVFYLAPSR